MQELTVGKLLVGRNWQLAVAESATGGYLGHLITTVPGSSRYFLGGVIAYSDEIKVNVLGVSPQSLKAWGAVSSDVAIQMATGVCRVTGADIGISITGIAGPGGATAFKPVGLYYIGLAAPGERWCWRWIFTLDRAGNNTSAAHAALDHLIRYLGRPV